MLSKVNLHFFLSEVLTETRLFKEAKFTLAEHIFDRVVVFGLWKNPLDTIEKTDYGLEIVRKKTLIRRYGNSYLLAKLTYLRKAVAALSSLEYLCAAISASVKLRPSHVSCHNLNLLPVAWLSAKLINAKLIYVPHELETERTGLHGVAKHLNKFIEWMFVRSCKAVVVVCQPIAEWYVNNYEIRNVFVIRNVPNLISISSTPNEVNLFRSEFNITDEHPIYIYQGVLGRERGIDSLIGYFSQHKDRHLVLMGYGDMEPEIRKAKVDFGNIHYKPAVDMQEIVKYTSNADYGLFLVNGPLSLSYEYCLPNKFFEYLHAGIPVVVSKNMTYLSSIVESSGLGLVLEQGDFSLLAAIEKINYSDTVKNIVAYRETCVWEHDAVMYSQVYS